MRTKQSDRVPLPTRSRAGQSAVKCTTNSILWHKCERASERACLQTRLQICCRRSIRAMDSRDGLLNGNVGQGQADTDLHVLLLLDCCRKGGETARAC